MSSLEIGSGNNILPINNQTSAVNKINLEENDEKFGKLMKECSFEEAKSLCVSIIYYEIDNNKNGLTNFDTISSPNALTWKKRLEEIEDVRFEKLKQEGKLEEAKSLCLSMIFSEINKNTRMSNIDSDIDTKVNLLSDFDRINTPLALKWKKRLDEVKK